MVDMKTIATAAKALYKTMGGEEELSCNLIGAMFVSTQL